MKGPRSGPALRAKDTDVEDSKRYSSFPLSSRTNNPSAESRQALSRAVKQVIGCSDQLSVRGRISRAVL